MNILDNWARKRYANYLKKFSGNYSLSNPDFVRAFFDINPTKDDYTGAIYASIDTWGLYFAKAVFRLYQITDKTIEIREHPMLNLFHNANSYQVWWEMAYKLAPHWGLWGSSFIHVKRNLLNKEPFAYQQLPPALVKRVKSETKLIDHYVYDDGTNQREFAPEDIIDLRYPNPQDEVSGFPIIQSVADQKVVQALQMAYMKKFYEKGGFVGLAFTTKTEMKKVNFDRLLKMLENRYSGQENAFNVGLFDSGVEAMKDPYSMKDMDMGLSRKLTKEDIFETWKVSKILVGAGESVNRNTADAAIYQFTSGLIDPLLNYVDSVLTRFSQREFGEEFRIKHDSLAPKDVEASLKYYETSFKNGEMTLNEWRDEEGWDKYPHELADVPLINVGGAVIRLDTGKQIGVEEEVEEPPAAQEDVKSIKIKSLSDDYKVLKWKQFNRKLEPAIRRFNREIKGYTDAQRRRILEAVKDNFIVGEVFNLTEENEILYQLLEIEIYSIFEAGYKYGSLQYDNVNKFNSELFGSTFDKITENSLYFNDTTLRGLSEVSGQNYDELEKGINNFYINSGNRVEALSVTASVGGFNKGIIQAMKDAGLRNKIWISNKDSRTRNTKNENHVEMDEVTKPIEEPFEVKSRGGVDLMMYPGDPNGSPENIINDRCTIIGE